MDVNTSTDAVGNGSSADTAVAGERVERTGPGRRARVRPRSARWLRDSWS